MITPDTTNWRQDVPGPALASRVSHIKPGQSNVADQAKLGAWAGRGEALQGRLPTCRAAPGSLLVVCVAPTWSRGSRDFRAKACDTVRPITVATGQPGTPSWSGTPSALAERGQAARTDVEVRLRRE
jgi:hypothetical protein